MRVHRVVEQVKEHIEGLLGEDHANDKESILTKIDEVAALHAEEVEEARTLTTDNSLHARLAAAVQEFAIWHSADYAQERAQLDPSVRGGVSACLWQRVIDAAGQDANLPRSLSGVHA